MMWGMFSALALALTTYVTGQRHVFGRLFALFCLSTAVWSLGAGFELLSFSLESKIFWAKVQYVGIAFLAPLWFMFVARYTDSWQRLQRFFPVLFISPLATLGLIWTNEFHHWVWTAITLDVTTKTASYDYGFWFTNIHTPYSYVLLASTLFMLGKALWNAQRSQRGQLYILVVAQALPIVCNLIYLAKLYPFDLTPIGFTLTNIVLAFGLFRFRLMKQLPIAYRSVFSHMQDGVVVLDKTWAVLDYNGAAQQLLCLVESHLQRPLLETYPELQGVYEALKLDKKASYREDKRSLELVLTPITKGQEVQGYILTLRDVTERDKLYQKVADREKRLRLLTNNMSDLICLHELDGRFLYLTPSSQSVLGYHPDELVTTSPFDLMHPEDVSFVRKQLKGFLNGEKLKHFKYRMRQRTGEYIWLETFAQAIHDDANLMLVTSSRDITETKQMQEQILEGALLYDALTHLPNRVLFLDRLQQALKRSERSGEGFAVMFLDLDRFKTVNDTLGHSAGDQLLIETARRIQSCVRAQDTVSRFGGDEFAVLLEGISESDASYLAERIQKTLQLPLKVHGHEVFSSASIGITLSREMTDPEQLLRNADLAMYQAKASGKARSSLFDERLHTEVMETMQLEVDLRKAFENNEFRVHYQPIIDMSTHEVSGFEALVRWQHPKRGLVPPNTFIPIAEEIGLITQIDQWVLTQACEQLGAWQRHVTRKLTMSVNLSTKNFLLTDLSQRLAEVLKQSGISAEQLKLEITESVLMENAEAGAHLLADLRRQGISLQIDDFGTGYSSLSYLHNLPLDSLKIDRSFIQQLSSESKLEIVKTIISLARSLKLDVVAEGIETEEQLEHLQELFCDYGQGYLFGKPMSSEQIETMVLPHPPLTTATAN
jgi:diguanylate cyclase (GGDEF)-like protein/PAS domain S-box-containing protein